ncbi:hypothetical protein ACOZ4Y_02270 [Komagataeibacter rhaeticus]
MPNRGTVGRGGIRFGGFPPGWAEWNDRFRDVVRNYWRGHEGADALAPRLLASPDQFDHQGRKPWACVNFLTAHDGFTLGGPASATGRKPQRRQWRGRSVMAPTRDITAANWGVEGAGPPILCILTLRGRQIRRAMLATLHVLARHAHAAGG